MLFRVELGLLKLSSAFPVKFVLKTGGEYWTQHDS